MILLVGAATLVSCSDSNNGDGSDLWSAYSPVVRERIEGLETSGDCAGLQAEFDTAEANDQGQKQRTGRDNADLMGYLNGAMDRLGC